MTGLFVKILNMSIAAGVLVPAVLVLRLALKKAPRWISCALWGLVALRLLVPMAVQSPMSLVPSVEFIPENITQMAQPEINSGFTALNEAVNPHLSEPEKALTVMAWVWVAGMAAMLLYSVVSWACLRWKLRPSLRLHDNVYCCDAVASPFVFGVLRPRIYLPSGMEQGQITYVLAHENAHLARRDHLWKPLGYLLLTVYWFNPLLWVGYVFLCRDIEAACDERVIKDMDPSQKIGYSEALVCCSIHRRQILACPLAFGEVGVKERVRAVLHYKKPAFWVLIGAAAICAVTVVCFLTDPTPCAHTYEVALTQAPTCTAAGVNTFSCSLCPDSYTEPVPTLAHTYGEPVEKTPATCTLEGSKQASCTACGDIKTTPIALLPHSFGEQTVTKEPNCSETGESSATCSECGQTHVVQILEKNDVHDMKNTVIRAATCADAGEGTDTCTRCGHTQSVTYALLEHSYKEGLVIQSTCFTEGGKQMICTVCGKEQWYTLPKTDDHVYTGIFGTCIWCGDVKPSQSADPGEGYSLLDGVTYQSNTGGLLPAPAPGRIWP